jgi:hypothetical protein
MVLHGPKFYHRTTYDTVRLSALQLITNAVKSFEELTKKTFANVHCTICTKIVPVPV